LDLDTIMETARTEAVAAPVAAPEVVATAPEVAPSPEPAPEPPAPTLDAAPTPAPDQGTPAVTPENPSPTPAPETTPETSPLIDAFKLAGIDPADPQRDQKLAEAFKAAKAAPPAAVVPAPVTTPPAPAETKVTLDDVMKEFIDNDAQCAQISAEFRENDKAANALAVRDDRGNLTGGKLFDIRNEMSRLSLLLQPVKLGDVELPHTLDEFQREQINQRLGQLRYDLLDARDQESQYRNAARRAAQAYYQHVDSARNGFVNGYREHQEKQERQASIEREAASFGSEWRSVFDEAFGVAALPPELKDSTQEIVKLTLLAKISSWDGTEKSFTRDGNPETDLVKTISTVLANQARAFDQHHRLRAAQYATQKRNDAQVQAPAAAVATSTQAQQQASQPRNAQEVLEQVMAESNRQRFAAARRA
jgi:hypothetical protein